MKIEVFDLNCPQLNRTVKVALDCEAEDHYRNQFKTEFNIPTTLRFLLKSQKGIESFLDVGANIGQFSISAGLLGIPTVAIEAGAANYLLLARALAANSFNHVMPLHVAASDGYYPVCLQDISAWTNISAIGNGDTPALPLDHLLPMLGRGLPDLIKVDVEGHEMHVLRGLEETLTQSRPMLIVEGNSYMSRASGGCEAILEHLASRDYELFRFNRDKTMYPVLPTSLQDTVVVDYFARPKGAAKDRVCPEIRIPTLEERIKYMEAVIGVGKAHRWHVSSILDRFAAENGQSPRLDAIRSRIEELEMGRVAHSGAD